MIRYKEIYELSNNETKSCCDFVPKDFVKWKDGEGVPKLTAPDKR